MHTSQPDIYAAGDVAQVFDPRLGRAIVDSLWDPARAQGRAAGMNMAGQAEHYIKGVPFNVTRLAGITTTIIGGVGGGGRDPDVIGIVRGDSEGWRYQAEGLVVQASDAVNRLRLLMGEQHVDRCGRDGGPGTVQDGAPAGRPAGGYRPDAGENPPTGGADRGAAGRHGSQRVDDQGGG